MSQFDFKRQIGSARYVPTVSVCAAPLRAACAACLAASPFDPKSLFPHTASRPASTLVYGTGLLLAMLCAVVSPPAAAQASGAASPAAATPTAPARLEFDVPTTIIGPALDSIKRQIDSPSSALKPVAPSLSEKAAGVAGGQQAPAIPTPLPVPASPAAATPLISPAAASATAEAAPPSKTNENAPRPLETTALRFSELKRLSKEEIVAAVTGRFTAYVLRGAERTVVLDFPSTQEQGRMFGRVILFIEREGTSKTRIMTVPEVQKWLAKNAMSIATLTMGNNIRVGEFARFFNTARFQGEPLTPDEQGLYDWLLQMQLLRQEERGVVVAEPEAIIVSVPQVSTVPGCPACGVTTGQRVVVVEHELSHARFATDTLYQNYVVWFWTQGMNAATRSKFTQFLRKRGYEAGIRELAANEMQAFLMHTPDPAIFNAAEVGMTEGELADLRRAFQAGLQAKAPPNPGKSYRLD